MMEKKGRRSHGRIRGSTRKIAQSAKRRGIRRTSFKRIADEQRTGTPFANPTNAILIHQVCFDHMNDNMKLYMISALQV